MLVPLWVQNGSWWRQGFVGGVKWREWSWNNIPRSHWVVVHTWKIRLVKLLLLLVDCSLHGSKSGLTLSWRTIPSGGWKESPGHGMFQTVFFSVTPQGWWFTFKAIPWLLFLWKAEPFFVQMRNVNNTQTFHGVDTSHGLRYFLPYHFLSVYNKSLR